MNFIAMDFETASAKRYSPVSLALVLVQDNQITQKFYTLIKPDVPFDQQNIAIHGIHPSDVVNSPSFPDVWQIIHPLFHENSLVAAHNSPFDVSVLQRTLEFYDIEPPHFKTIDTVKTSKHFYPNLPNHRLNTVSQYLNIDLEHHHNALDDTVAAANILMTQNGQFGYAKLKPFIRYK